MAYLNQFEDAMKKSFGSANPTETLTAVFSSIYQGLPEVLNTASEAAKIWDDLAQSYGFDLSNVGGNTSATTGVQASFTQDSVDEANGRMAALQMGQQEQLNTQIKIASGIESILMSGQAGNAHLNNLVNLAGIRNGYLVDIYNRIGQMAAAMGAKLGKIELNTGAL